MSELVTGVALTIDRDVALDNQRGALEHLASLLRAEAAAVDDEVFPVRGLAVLRSAGLMGLLVPRENGGLGGGLSELALAGRMLGRGCVSTALIWAMHCQQVAVIATYAGPQLRERLLPAIAAGDLYIASVTSEAGSGQITSVQSPLLRTKGSELKITRDAPVVTGGAHADAFLITMRRDVETTPEDVVLVYADRHQLDVQTKGVWRTMGVRGTQSGPLHLAGVVPDTNIIDPPRGFPRAAASLMIPAGHVAWASAWLGGAEGALREVISALKDPHQRRRLRKIDDLAAERIARIRIMIDIVDSFLRSYVSDYATVYAREGVDGDTLHGTAFNIRTNNLKVVASEMAFSAVTRLVELAGLSMGYQRGAPLERTFRDLRSAALMYSNDRLLVASGKLALFETKVEPFIWQLNGADASEGR